MTLFVWRTMAMEWWAWVLVGWVVMSVGLAAMIARWFRWLRDG